MTPAACDWLAGLRESVSTSRRSATLVPAEPAAAAAERGILAVYFATWLDSIPTLLEARRGHALASHGQADPDAAIVVTSSPVGIAAAEKSLGERGLLADHILPRIACVTEREYRAWCMRHPDDEHRLHVNHWSWIKTRVPPQRDAEFARHPLAPGERYWLHRTGTVGAGTADRRATHLWKFNGHGAVLLEAFVVEGRGGPPGA